MPRVLVRVVRGVLSDIIIVREKWVMFWVLGFWLDDQFVIWSNRAIAFLRVVFVMAKYGFIASKSLWPVHWIMTSAGIPRVRH